MLVPGDLGFPGLSLVFFFVIVTILNFVIRWRWRIAVEKKQEIMRLVAMASEEAARVELEAAAEYGTVSVVRQSQCAVCYCPTTTRCSRCKSVRYCSGKCQIIHWRQGHKDECNPPSIGFQFNGPASDFNQPLQEQGVLETEDRCHTKPNKFSKEPASLKPSYSPALSSEQHDGKVDPFMDTEGTDNSSECFSVSSLVDSSTSSTSESTTGSSVCEVFISCPDRVEGPQSDDDVSHDVSSTTGCYNGSELPTSRSSRLDSTVNDSCLSKLNKTTPSCTVGVVGHGPNYPPSSSISSSVESNIPKTSSVRFDFWEGAIGSNESGNDICDSTSSSFSEEMKDGIGSSSGLLKPREMKLPSPSSYSEKKPSSMGEHSSSSMKSSVVDSAHRKPAVSSEIPIFVPNGSTGLKISVRKAVHQFKLYKLSKHNSVGMGIESAEKYNYKMLFPYEMFIKLYHWNKVELRPCGLVNTGNSCYANTVLQCLTFTRPLTAYLLQGLHSKACSKKGWCFTCEFEGLILKAKEGKSPLSPIGILSQLHSIGSHLGHGKEEDAHEFLRYAIDTMQSICLKEAGENAVEPLAEETTLIGLIFGGYLRSKIKCMKCHGKSERQERMMDLTVEIQGDIGTLEEALKQFTATEILDGENKYRCSRCRSYEKAKKKLTVLEAPNVLTIALKRFQSGKFGKLNKSVKFPEILNLAPFMSGTSDKSPIYRLYAVVVHIDIMNAAFSGHYVCYISNMQGKWFKIDDSTVKAVELDRVLSKEAYMLLYSRYSPRAPSLIRKEGKGNQCSDGKRNSSGARPPMSTFEDDDCWTSWDGSESFDSFDRRFHPLHRIHKVDSSSDSSSLLSCSDEGSCSTESTRESTDDLTDYIFGEAGGGRSSWNGPLRAREDCEASSETRTYRVDGKMDPFLEGDKGKQCRKLTSKGSSFSHSSRESELEKLGWCNPLEVKHGVSQRRSTRDRTASQTLY